MKHTSPRIVIATILFAIVAGCSGRGGEIRLLGPDPKEQLIDALRSPDPDRRHGALVKLAKSRDYKKDWAVRGMVLIVRADPVPQIRAMAMHTLGRVADHRIVDQAMTSLSEENGAVRTEAAWALGQVPKSQIDASTHSQPVKEALLKVLAEDTEMDARAHSATALSRFHQVDTAKALISALNDPEFTVAYHAESALITMTGRTFRGNPAAWSKWLGSTSTPFADAGKTPPELVKPKQGFMKNSKDRMHQFYLNWQGAARE